VTTQEPAALEKEGLQLYEAGEYAEALDRLHEAQQLYAARDDIRGVVEMWNDIGVVHYRQKQWDEAVEALRQAETIAVDAGHQEGQAKALGNLGTVYAGQGEEAAAEECLTQAIDIFRELGDDESVQYCVKTLSNLTLKRGRWVEALYYHERRLSGVTEPSAWEHLQSWMVTLLKRTFRLP